MKKANAITNAGSWKLENNEVWNIPAKPTNQVHFEMVTVGPWQIIKTLKALVIDMDGGVYGIRSMYAPSEIGYTSFGRVSLNGKKVKAFTSSRMFEREDGSLCDVAVFII